MAGDQNSIFAVGDSDQSIYKWRGADYRNIQNFYQDFPESKTILLEQNYRSTQIILDAAIEVIRHNTDHIPKKLFTERAGGSKIMLREAYNEADEAATGERNHQRDRLGGIGRLGARRLRAGDRERR